VTTAAVVEQLRTLIVTAAPDPAQAAAARGCPMDMPLDTVMPFSSVIALGVIVAVEDRFGIVVTRDALQGAFAGGATLEKLAVMIQRLRG
jgi:acyl carrier protein